MCGDTIDEILRNSLRFKQFSQSATKAKLNVSSLPSTQAAAWLHTLWTNHQVQTMAWIRSIAWRMELKRTAWGLRPIFISTSPVALYLCNVCQCKAKCGASYGFKKLYLEVQLYVAFGVDLRAEM